MRQFAAVSPQHRKSGPRHVLGFGVWGLGFGVWGLGFGPLPRKEAQPHGQVCQEVVTCFTRSCRSNITTGLGFNFGVWVLGFVDWNLGFRVGGWGFGV